MSPTPVPDPTMIEIPFVWWTDIIIPGFNVFASVIIAIAALVATQRASKIARDAEEYRLAAEERVRIAEEQRRNLEIAQEEARTVSRWIDLAYQATVLALTNGDSKATLRYQAYADAKTTLEHSFFPGARDLFQLTLIDTKNVTTLKVIDGETTGMVIDLDERTRYHRQRRTLERARLWALDPDGEEDPIRQELEYARGNLDEYLALALPDPR